MQSEKSIEKYLQRAMRARGGVATKFPALYLAGMPDRFCLMPFAKLYFVELKSEGKKPSPIQLKMHDFLAGLGFPVYVLDTRQQVVEFLKIVDADQAAELI